MKVLSCLESQCPAGQLQHTPDYTCLSYVFYSCPKDTPSIPADGTHILWKNMADISANFGIGLFVRFCEKFSIFRFVTKPKYVIWWTRCFLASSMIFDTLGPVFFYWKFDCSLLETVSGLAQRSCRLICLLWNKCASVKSISFKIGWKICVCFEDIKGRLLWGNWVNLVDRIGSTFPTFTMKALHHTRHIELRSL